MKDKADRVITKIIPKRLKTAGGEVLFNKLSSGMQGYRWHCMVLTGWPNPKKPDYMVETHEWRLLREFNVAAQTPLDWAKNYKTLLRYTGEFGSFVQFLAGDILADVVLCGGRPASCEKVAQLAVLVDRAITAKDVVFTGEDLL